MKKNMKVEVSKKVDNKKFKHKNFETNHEEYIFEEEQNKYELNQEEYMNEKEQQELEEDYVYEIAELENEEDCANQGSNSSARYSGHISRGRKIIFSPPKEDKIISITSVNREVYIDDIERLDNGVNVNAVISVSINYGTAKDILIEGKENKKNEDKEKKENKKDESNISEGNNEHKRGAILTDGVVRNATMLIPCNIFIRISEIDTFDELKLINKYLKVTNTQYMLDDETVTDGFIPIGHSLIGIMENYIVSLEVEGR